MILKISVPFNTARANSNSTSETNGSQSVLGKTSTLGMCKSVCVYCEPAVRGTLGMYQCVLQ